MPVSLGCAMQMLRTDGANELHATTPSHLGLTTLSPGSARIPLPFIFFLKSTHYTQSCLKLDFLFHGGKC